MVKSLNLLDIQSLAPDAMQQIIITQQEHISSIAFLLIVRLLV